ncbi:ABC transporter ATP-binding protein [Paucibacter sp. APW11]|uniref:ABC transporter ATP-binding protein n=1 Tax=Roseateles aquae TaxID=3077235 RepID=A0ABU3P6U8_9BURK|nr:ABC transporter ATP-binding protein [Paucibacter sp. APW11]MDT8998307.1 ABC transporter ATP-binding protein [Paucibacter sp. APW11]
MLEVEGLEAAYGDSQVLFGLDLRIERGEVATLLGRNGMGKSSLIKCLCGWLKPRGGRIRFAGEDITGWSADRIARLGLALVPEGRQIFPNLSVRENLLAFAANRSGAISMRWDLERVYALFPRLQQRHQHMGGQLSGGEQQMLAIGRALLTNPHLLILDEATEGLAPLIREEIWRCLAQLRSQGQTILVVDKYVRRLIALADRHSILERGRIAWQGDSPALDADPSLWQRYVGV